MLVTSHFGRRSERGTASRVAKRLGVCVYRSERKTEYFKTEKVNTWPERKRYIAKYINIGQFLKHHIE